MDPASKPLTERTLRQKTEKQSFLLFVPIVAMLFCTVSVFCRRDAEIQQGRLKRSLALIWKVELSRTTTFLKTLQCSILAPNSTSTSEFAPNAGGEVNSPVDINSGGKEGGVSELEELLLRKKK